MTAALKELKGKRRDVERSSCIKGKPGLAKQLIIKSWPREKVCIISRLMLPLSLLQDCQTHPQPKSNTCITITLTNTHVGERTELAAAPRVCPPCRLLRKRQRASWHDCARSAWSVPVLVPDDSPLSQPEDKYEERMCKAIITLQHDHFGRIYMTCWEVTD